MGKITDFNVSRTALTQSQIVAIDDTLDRNGHSTSPDMLDYVADMLAELKVMAASTRCETLTGLIDLAAKEAQIRHRNPR
jgi:hypothetical protein